MEGARTGGEDGTLLETMLLPFFSKHDRWKSRASFESDRSDLDLGRILAGQEGEFVAADDDEVNLDSAVGSSDGEDDVPIEVLFEKKDGPFFYRQDDEQSLAPSLSIATKLLREDKAEKPTPEGENKRVNRCPFYQTRNVNYRNFMEEAMLVKYCSKKILQCLEDTKLVLEHYVEIKNDPGFGRIHQTQAWVWILKESCVTAYQTLQSNKKRKRIFSSFLGQMMTRAEKDFRQLVLDTKTVSKTFDKVWREIEILSGKAFERLRNNLANSFEYEMRTSGYNFFLHRKDSLDSLQDLEELGKHDHESAETAGEQSLQVRCGVDGVTLRTGKKDSSWIKFQKVDQDRDLMLLCNIFFSKLTEMCTKVRTNLILVNDLLAVVNQRQGFANQPVPDSILQSIFKCQNILDKPQSQVNFFPKEESIMLYSLKTTKATFELIRPLLTEFVLSTDRQFASVYEFCKQQSKLKRCTADNQFPANLNSRFELFIEDAKFNTEIILNRYPNIRDAKIHKEKLLKRMRSETSAQSDADSIQDDTPSTDTLYKCPSKVFYAKSAQEMIDMFRKLITQQRHMTDPNPAHYLFTDVEQEYTELTRELAATRTITPEMIPLCSDPIQSFYNAAMEQSKFKDRMLVQIVYATQKLLYADSGNLTPKQKKGAPGVSSWIQALCKMLHIWDFHSLPKHLRHHFLAKNEDTLRWIARLEAALAQFTELVKAYKDELNDFHEFVETNHGFITWVRRTFEFNPPNEILEKWTKEPQEDEQGSLGSFFQDAPRYQLRFGDFDMTLVEYNPENNSTARTLASLNKSSSKVQVGLVTTLLTYFDQVVSSAIVNLNSAQAIHEKYINLKSLKEAICPRKKLICLKYIYQLEDLVLALTFETVRKNLKETIAYVGLLNSTIAQFSRMFQTVQLHLEERGMARNKSSSLPNRKSSGKEFDFEEDHRHHDRYLNETVQLLKSSVEAMPKVFEIRADQLVNSYVNWARLAERDAELLRNLLPIAEPPEEEQKKEESDQEDGKQEDENVWPIDFEQAMMQTTTGKSFFPDPSQFASTNIECWRTMCFQMLSTALNKFREMTVTKILDAKLTLSNPHLSQTSLKQESKTDKGKAPLNTVGYIEGLCSLLCIMTEQLIPRDRATVSKTDVKLLKEKFSMAVSTVGKFKKGLDAAEKVLVNNLSLSMASVESKRLPQYLPVLPLESDMLKSHDLDEVGSRVSEFTQMATEDKSETVTTGENPNEEFQGERSRRVTFATGNFVEIQWDSANRDRIFCSSDGDSEKLTFSQLQINGQLRLLHLLLDEIIDEFVKALVLVKEAKADLSCAKTLLEKTWKGIGNDMKKRLMPGSSIIVLLKLYRHQVATAVINLKEIRRTGQEVKYLLGESTKSASLWVHSKSSSKLHHTNTNKFLTDLHHLSLTVQLKVAEPGIMWLKTDRGKRAQEEANQTTAQALESKPILELMSAVRVSSSTTIVQPRITADSTTDPGSSAKSQIGEKRLSILKEAKNTEDFHNAAVTIQTLVLSQLAESLTLLKLPNCQAQTETTGVSNKDLNESTTNVMALLTALSAVSMDIRFFREVMPQERNFVLKRIAAVLEVVVHLQNDGNGVLEQISSILGKLRKSVKSLDANFRSKFTAEEEFPGIDEMVSTPYQQGGITPLEFVEGLAQSIDGYIWTLTCGLPEIGTMIKYNKTLESHAVANIPLPSKVELVLAIVNYLEKLVVHVQTSLDSGKQDLLLAKSLLKSKGKEITASTRNKKRMLLLGFRWKAEDILLSPAEIKEHLESFARINCACAKAQENVTQIQYLVQSTLEIVQQVFMYINLKFKLEPSVGAPNIDNDVILRAQNWQTVDAITGLASPPNVPPPVILKKITKRSQKQESIQQKYKGAWENRVLELEVYFKLLCNKHCVSVDVPTVFAPRSNTSTAAPVGDEDYEN